MQVQLRPYQTAAIDQVRAVLTATERKAILTIATGGGKTTVAAEIIRRGLDRGSRTLFIAHRRELVEQCVARLKTFGINAGVIMAGKALSVRPVNVASVQTLARRMDKLPKADLVIVDECHHSTAGGFRKIINAYADQGGYVLGLTATPYRADGKGLGDIYDSIVSPITISQLTSEGFLCPARYFGPEGADMADVKVSKGDYDTAQMFRKYDKRELYARCVENYQTFAHDTKAIVFGVNVKHSLETTGAFNAAGIAACHLDGETPPIERARVLRDFAAGRFAVLCNVNLFTEGFDLPAIETVILNRATKSKSLYMQMVGRGLRPAPGKEYCIVIDQGNNVKAFGMVDQEEVFTLSPTKKKTTIGAPPVKECPECHSLLHLSAKFCNYCGYVYPIDSYQPVAEFKEIESTTTRVLAPIPEHLKRPVALLTPLELAELRDFKKYKLGWLIRQAKQNNPGREREALADVAGYYGYKPGWVERQLSGSYSH